MSDIAVRKSKDMDMTSGPLWNKILLFAIPLALTTLMQQLFHSMDMAVIGRFEGQNELAAVGSNNAIINFLVNMFMGFSAGSNVVIAQLLGGSKIKLAKKAICTSLGIAVISGVCVMILGVIFSPFLLKLISTILLLSFYRFLCTPVRVNFCSINRLVCTYSDIVFFLRFELSNLLGNC